MTRIAALVDRRNVTVMFVDVADSTVLLEHLARSGDEEFSYTLLSSAMQAIAQEVQRFSGHVSKTTGDGAMAIFGAPLALEDHAIRAAHAALAIRERMRQLGAELQRSHGLDFQVRIGLNTGPVVMSVSGSGAGETYDAAGSPVHLAQRIEASTPVGAIGVSARTRLLAAAAFEFERLGSFQPKGFAQQEDIFLLQGTRHRATAPAGGPHGPVSARMVGRARERRQFQSALGALDHGHGALLLVRGEAGCGKTRFITECRTAAGEELLGLQGSASPYEQRRSYLPFTEMLADWLRLGASPQAPEHWHPLRDRLQHLFAEDAQDLAPYVATLMGIPVPEPDAGRLRQLDADVLGRQIFGAMHRLFGRIAQQQPVLLVVEDAQWCDDSSARLIQHLLPLCLQARFFVCVSARTGEEALHRLADAAAGIEGLPVTTVDLPPLTPDKSAELLEQLVSNDPQHRQLRERILYKAGGNPFFIEEVVRSLAAAGLLVPGAQAGAWSAASAEIALPDTIQDVVMARVDRLDARLKQVLLTASVIGRSFLVAVLRAVEQQDTAVDQQLDELARRQFVEALREAPEAAYAFRHALTQEVVYRSLLAQTRRRLHELVGDSLLAAGAGAGGAPASAVAFHYARAEQPDKALKFLLEAAEQSSRMAASAETLQYYEEALAAYEAAKGAVWAPWQRATIECRLAQAYHHCGNIDAAHAHFLRALQACGQQMPQSRPRLLLATARQVLVQLGRRWRPQREPVAAATTDPLEEIRYRVFEAYAWLLATLDQERMGYAILRYLNIAEALGVAEPMAKAASGCALALNILGLHRLAAHYHTRALRWARRSGNPVTVAMVQNIHGLHHAHTGHWDDALQCFGQARQLAVQSGDLNTWYTSSLHRMQILQERGAFAEVLDIGVALVRKGRETGHDATSYLGLGVLGCVMGRLGSWGRATAALGISLQRASAAGDHLSATFLEGELALCLLAQGDLDAAAQHVDRALARVRRFTVRSNPVGTVLLAQAELALARLAQGPSAQAVGQARRACREALASTRRFRFGLVRAQRLVGQLHAARGQPSRAQRWWADSLATAQALQAGYEEALTRHAIARQHGAAEPLAQAQTGLLRFRRDTESSAGLQTAVDVIGSLGVASR